MSGSHEHAKVREADRYFPAYVEYSKVLRTWLVAYGIGAPVLLTTNVNLSAAIAASGDARLITSAFLGGVVLQVIIASLNKLAMWGLYYGDLKEDFKSTHWYKSAYQLSETMWPDFLVDVGSMILFASATWTALEAVFY